MPVEKFHTHEAARQALWMDPDDPLLIVRMRRLGAMARSRRPILRGVRRERTIEDAKRDKGAAWQVRPDLVP